MLQEEHSAILSTFIKLPFIIRSLFCLFLSDRFTQVLLYKQPRLWRDCAEVDKVQGWSESRLLGDVISTIISCCTISFLYAYVFTKPMHYNKFSKQLYTMLIHDEYEHIYILKQ